MARCLRWSQLLWVVAGGSRCGPVNAGRVPCDVTFLIPDTDLCFVFLNLCHSVRGLLFYWFFFKEPVFCFINFSLFSCFQSLIYAFSCFLSYVYFGFIILLFLGFWDTNLDDLLEILPVVHACSTINFPLRNPIIAPYKYAYVVLIFIPFFALLNFEISSVTHGLLRNAFNFQVFANFPVVFLLLISCLILFW